MIRFLITLTCLFASATLGAALALFTGWPIAILTGALAFLFTQQMSGSFARGRDRRVTAREIAALRSMTLEFDQSLNATRHRMDDLTRQLEERTDAHSKKIVSELKVLESLMREFAGRSPERARRTGLDRSPQREMQTGRRQGPAAPISTAMGEPRLLETIRASLEENRVDLYLQPIVSLPQRKLRYLRSLVAAARRGRLGDHAGAIYQGRGAGRTDERGRQSPAVPLRADRAPPDAEEPRCRRVLQHLGRHA